MNCEVIGSPPGPLGEREPRGGDDEEHPAGREGRVEEIAAAIAFLASDEASYAIRSLFMVDGG